MYFRLREWIPVLPNMDDAMLIVGKIELHETKVVFSESLWSCVQTYYIPYKIKHLMHNIVRLYWTNFWQPTVHAQQNIFEKTPIEICSTLLYASFAPFASKSVIHSRHRESLKYVWKSTNHRHRREMSSILEFFRIFKDSLCLE